MRFRVFKVLVYDEEGTMGGFACVLCMSRNKENQSERRWSMILRMLLLLCFQRNMLDGKDWPIISTLEYAREYLMKRIVNVKQVRKRSDGPLTPTATRLFNVIKAEASQCIANFNRGYVHGNKFTVTTLIPLEARSYGQRVPFQPPSFLQIIIHVLVGHPITERSLLGHNKRSYTSPRKDACNKGSTSNAGKKRPRSETTTGINQTTKKPNNVAVGVQTRSKATNKGNQPTATVKKLVNKAKKKV
nr:transposase, mutator type [Tanacetum cinerariifolium]